MLSQRDDHANARTTHLFSLRSAVKALFFSLEACVVLNGELESSLISLRCHRLSSNLPAFEGVTM